MNILKPSQDILKSFFSNRDQNLKLKLSSYLNTRPGINRNEVTRVVYGVARKEKLIEYIAGKFASRETSGIDEKTRILLYIGIYLICFSKSYPDYAVVNEIVDLSGARAGGFLNAVLRKVTRQRTDVETMINGIQDPTIRYSVSEEVIENLNRITTDTNQALAYLDSEPVFHVRMNMVDADTDKGRKMLEDRGISFRIIDGTGSFEIENAGEMVRNILPDHNFYFQNTGSFAVSAVTASFKGKRILDCCAAPGTKSLTLSLSLPESDILASDINLKRLMLFLPVLKNSGRSNIKLAAGDITSVPFKNVFDTILIDAPCTSSGTLRKNPDLKNKINRINISKNSRIQKRILQAVMNWAKPGATIVYAVCSFIQDETEQVLNDSLVQSGEDHFEMMDTEKVLNQYGYNLKSGKFGTFLLPHYGLNNDLFYISVIRKK